MVSILSPKLAGAVPALVGDLPLETGDDVSSCIAILNQMAKDVPPDVPAVLLAQHCVIIQNELEKSNLTNLTRWYEMRPTQSASR